MNKQNLDSFPAYMKAIMAAFWLEMDRGEGSEYAEYPSTVEDRLLHAASDLARALYNGAPELVDEAFREWDSHSELCASLGHNTPGKILQDYEII